MTLLRLPASPVWAAAADGGQAQTRRPGQSRPQRALGALTAHGRGLPGERSLFVHFCTWLQGQLRRGATSMLFIRRTVCGATITGGETGRGHMPTANSDPANGPPWDPAAGRPLSPRGLCPTPALPGRHRYPDNASCGPRQPRAVNTVECADRWAHLLHKPRRGCSARRPGGQDSPCCGPGPVPRCPLRPRAAGVNSLGPTARLPAWVLVIPAPSQVYPSHPRCRQRGQQLLLQPRLGGDTHFGGEDSTACRVPALRSPASRGP